MKNVSKDNIPANLDEAVSLLESGLSTRDRKAIAESSPHDWHFSVGMHLRNTWKLWEPQSPLSLWFGKLGIYHADDMSGIIIKALKCKVDETEFDLTEEVAYYKSYWANKDNFSGS